jgi:hypothetical protein
VLNQIVEQVDVAKRHGWASPLNHHAPLLK